MKKNTLIVGLLSFLVMVTLAIVDDKNESICRYYDISGVYIIKYCEIMILSLLPFSATILFSLITYRMKEEVFLSWLLFSYWWIPLSVFLTLITPNGGGGGFGMNFGEAYQVIAILCLILYIFISAVLIFVKYVTFYTPPQKTRSEKIKGKTK